MAYPMSATKLVYQCIVNSIDFDPIPLPSEDEDGDVAPVWIVDSTSTMDYLNIVLPSDEAILEAMTGVEIPWDDLHHHSYFLPSLQEVESNLSSPYFSGNIHNPLVPSHIYAEGNMSSILKTIPVNIS